MTGTLNTRNIEHSLLNLISKRKRKYLNRYTNSPKERNRIPIIKIHLRVRRTYNKTNKEKRISFSIKYN